MLKKKFYLHKYFLDIDDFGPSINSIKGPIMLKKKY